MSLADLAALPSSRLEALGGDRKGQYSIRINQQWRICFEWPADATGPSNAEIVDYHQRRRTMPRPPIHPGEILADELKELGVTPTELSRQIDVPPNRLSQIIQGKRSITGDTALRLGHWFKTSAEFWLNLQTAYDLRLATKEVGGRVAKLPRKPDGITQSNPT